MTVKSKLYVDAKIKWLSTPEEMVSDFKEFLITAHNPEELSESDMEMVFGEWFRQVFTKYIEVEVSKDIKLRDIL